MPVAPLARARDNRVLAGVCEGLGAHLGIAPQTVRVVMLLGTMLGGAGALFYVWLWLTVPWEGESDALVPLKRALTKPAEGQDPPEPTNTAASAAPGSSSPATPTIAGVRWGNALAAGRSALGGGATAPPDPPRSSTPGASSSVSGEGSAASSAAATTPAAARTRWPIAELLLGVCLLIAGGGLLLDRLGMHLRLEVLLPALAVLVGVGLTWWQIADRGRTDRNPWPRALAALSLVAVGVLMFFVTAREPNAWTVIGAAVAVLAGVALAVTPWLLRQNRELIAERAGRAREAERSEIAAHLHDSVLQTLALIQQRSEPGSEVARIARGQERELREWLFRGADGAAEPMRAALDTDVRAHAAALEAEFPVRFEVVAVGVQDGFIAPAPIVAAAREAMLNAARHAGGDATVYLEVTKDRVAIDVTDRGPGLNLDDLPEGRMGVRESILGRMERAGGRARIVPGPGGGTSVRLDMPREVGHAGAGGSDDAGVGSTTLEDEPNGRPRFPRKETQ